MCFVSAGKMNQRVLPIFIFYLLKSCGAFDLNQTPLTVSTNGSEITVSLPDESDLISVFFSTELRNQCSTGFTFMNNLNDSGNLVYRQIVNDQLKINDKIRLLGVFESKDQVIRKSFDYKIDSQGNGVQQTIAMNPGCKCNPSVTEVQYRKVECSGKLIFEENFKGDMSKWKHEVRTLWYSKFPFQEFVVYTKDQDTWELKPGQLDLKARWMGDKIPKFQLNGCTSKLRNQKQRESECGPLIRRNDYLPCVLSAKVYSHAFSFKYGRVEIRAKFALGDWLLSYLILQPLDTIDDNLSSHIRVYVRGNKILQDTNINSIGAGTLFGSAILVDSSGPIEYKKHYSILDQTFADNFHNYTIIWREDKILFKCDGITYGEITDRTILNELNLNEHSVALGLTAGGGLNFPDDYVLIKPFKNNAKKASSLFVENTEKVLHTWTKPNMSIASVQVYSIHANEE